MKLQPMRDLRGELVDARRRASIFAAWCAGDTYLDTARKYGVREAQVCRIVRRYLELAPDEPLPRRNLTDRAELAERLRRAG